MAKSDLPFSGQFTPNQIELPQILEIIHNHAGNRAVIEQLIGDTFFSEKPGKIGLAENTFLSMRAYGLLQSDEDQPTPLANALFALINNETELYTQFARHILLSLHGYDLVQTILDIQHANEEVTLLTIHKRLGERGIHFAASGTYISGMRLWLQKAGIFDTNDTYSINLVRLNEIVGATVEQIDALSSLEPEQRDFLKALANLGVGTDNFYLASEVAELAYRLYGTTFDPKTIPGRVLSRLEAAGFIMSEKSTDGRGAKSHRVKPTESFTRTTIIPLLEASFTGLDRRLREMLYRPLTEIIEELSNLDKNIKGKALEALVLRLTRLLDLQFVGWRLRQQRTGGAEVDVLVESDRLIFSRWQIQCKNTDFVRLDDIAKEVGLTFYLLSNVIMIVTTGKIGKPAREYARGIMRTTNLHIILIDGKDLSQLRTQPTAIVAILDREAKNTLELKRLNVRLEEL